MKDSSGGIPRGYGWQSGPQQAVLEHQHSESAAAEDRLVVYPTATWTGSTKGVSVGSEPQAHPRPHADHGEHDSAPDPPFPLGHDVPRLRITLRREGHRVRCSCHGRLGDITLPPRVQSEVGPQAVWISQCGHLERTTVCDSRLYGRGREPVGSLIGKFASLSLLVYGGTLSADRDGGLQRAHPGVAQGYRITGTNGPLHTAGPTQPQGLLGTTTVGLAQHPDEHRSERPVLLAVDQKLGEGADANSHFLTARERTARGERLYLLHSCC